MITNEVALAAHRPYAYLPDRRGRHVVHVPPLDQRPARDDAPPHADDARARSSPTVITNWNDPGDRARQPAAASCRTSPIRPIVRSDGSGTTAQFSAFMASQTPDVWNAFCRKVGVNVTPCRSVSLWPDINATVAAVLRRRRRLRRRAVQQRRDHVRRVRLRQAARASRSPRSSTRRATTRSRPRATSRSRCRARRSTPTSPRTSAACTRSTRIARRVPGVELQLPDRARPPRPRRSPRPRARRSASSSSTWCARASRRPPSSAIRRCRRTSCRTRSTSCRRSPGT